MAKDPAFLFYTNDFSSGTQFFSDEQLGKYLRLLMAQHQHGHLTEKQVIFICKSYDNDIMSKFEKDEGGLYFNERLEFEIDRRKKYSESRGSNKSGKIKPKKNKIISKSYDNHMETVNENEIVNRKEKETLEKKPDLIFPFDTETFLKTWELWKQYKKDQHKFTYKHISEQAALKSISALANGSEQTAIQIIHQSINNGWKGFFELKNNGNGNNKTQRPILTAALEVLRRAGGEGAE